MIAFPQRLAQGRELGEERVARWLERRYLAEEATAAEQRRGIDLHVWRAAGPGGRALEISLEVKCQVKPGDGFFIETTGGGLAEPGWLFTSEADLFAFVDAACRFVLLARPDALRSRIAGWLSCCGQAHEPAGRGRSRASGVFVPWHELHGASLGLWWLSAPPPGPEVLLVKGGAP